MLNEENELDFEQPQVEDLPKLDGETGSKPTGLFTTEASLSEAVDTVLSNIDELTTGEETVSTDTGTLSDDNSLEKDVSHDEDKNKEETDEEKPKPEQGGGKSSRELKSILELSKEANLDTNIAYKRKSYDPNKQVEHQDHKYASVTPDAKRSMRSQNPEFIVKHHRFLSKLTYDGDSTGTPEGEEKAPKEKTQRKIREFLNIGGAIDEKTRKLLKPVMALIQNNKDGFCWRCHRESITLSCETCPRSYHLKCLKHGTINTERWACPECVVILNAENTKTRSPALKDMSLEQLCGLLKFALKRMAQCNDSEPFLRPVNEIEFPDYKKYIVQPMDLSRMQRNIRENLYGSTNAFEADAKWLVHNSIIFNSYQSKLTTIAKSILKVCKQEMSEIENCPTCYLNANTKKNWFVEVCPKPHVLLWAKLKSFPYWPAKAMCTNPQGMVDVRFFGAHDRAWVPFKECFLYSLKDPNSHKQMKNDIIECVKELEVHIENLKSVYGEFHYAPFRTPYDPENEVQQLKLLLPTYIPAYHTSVPRKFLKIDTLLKRRTMMDYKLMGGKQSPKTPSPGEQLGMDKNDSQKEMEGYGTDDEMETDADGRIKSIPRQISGTQIRPSPINSRSRRNSDQSTKSDMSRISNISERISTMDFTENTEIELYNDEFRRKSVDSQQSAELKKSDSSNKLKISDKLMKRLSENSIKGSDGSKMDVSEIEENLNESLRESALLDEVEKDVVESEESPSRSDINEVILGSPPTGVQVLQVDPDSESPVDSGSDSMEGKQSEKKSVKEGSKRNEVDRSIITVIKRVTKSNSTDAPNPAPTTTSTVTAINDDRVDRQTSDDLLEEMYSVAVDASGLSNSERNKNEEVTSSETNVTNKRKRADESEDNEAASAQNKFIKVVDFNAIKKLQSGATITIKSPELTSILKTRLAGPESSTKVVAPDGTGTTTPTTIEIKSEPSSDGEGDGKANEDIEAKKQYLSALNISEKIIKAVAAPVAKEHRVRSRTEVASSANSKTKKVDVKAKKGVESMEVTQEKRDALPRLIKQLPPKQRARKSFPRPTNLSPKPMMKIDNNPKPPPKVNPNPPPKPTPVESQPNNSNVVILTQPQQPVVNSLTVLPPNQTIAYTTNMNNPILTMVQPTQFSNFIVPTTSLNPVPPLNPISERIAVTSQGDPSQATLTLNGLLASANALFTSSTAVSDPSTCGTTSTITFTTSTVTAPVSSSGTASTSNVNTITLLNGQAALPALIGSKQQTTPTDVNEDFSYLTGYVPENISKSISDLIHRAPPKLKPKPPGPLSNSYDPGLPSSAGRITGIINSVAHKLTDYFRGMLVETLNDLGTIGNPEGVITNLRLENERLKYKHSEEILEIKKNVNSILRDIQKSIIDERERTIEETRSACEAETIKRIEEAKAKQWCANCMKEAQFYCCWNTSYCDYPCQLKHWPKHMSKCTQSANVGQIDNPAMAKLVAPFVLRKTAPPPKSFAGKAPASKTNKDNLNKSSPNKAALGTLKAPTVNAVTIVDTSKQWTFDINSAPSTNLQTTATSLAGKVLSFNKIKTVSMLAPSTSNVSSSSVIITTPTQKFIVTPTKQISTIEAVD